MNSTDFCKWKKPILFLPPILLMTLYVMFNLSLFF